MVILSFTQWTGGCRRAVGCGDKSGCAVRCCCWSCLRELRGHERDSGNAHGRSAHNERARAEPQGVFTKP